MKKIHSILIFFMALWPLVTFAQVDEWDGTAVQWTQGTGTEADPYLIQSAEHLAKLAQNVNSGTTYSGQYFKLTTDLNLKNILWIPIGKDTTNSFQGTFDGDNHFIDSLYYNASFLQYVGLFGCVKNATLKKINVNANITQRYSSAASYASGICGFASGGTISDCSNSGMISSSSSYSSSYSGGICGYAYASSSGMVSISNCSNFGTISSSSSYAGGICGYANTASGSITISGCENSGDISSSSFSSCTGGICGYAKTASGTITIRDCSNSGSSSCGGICGHAVNEISSSGTIVISDCSNSGDVTSSYYSYYVGGICGYAINDFFSSGTIIISDCSNSGTISSSSSYAYNAYAGGICGNTIIDEGEGTITIRNCFNSGTISSSSTSSVAYAGGICGCTDIMITVSDCSNSGDVTSSYYAGGICGRVYGSGFIRDFNIISNCLNSGIIFSTSSYSDAYAGGICGYVEMSYISNCLNFGTISTTSSSRDAYAGGICAWSVTVDIINCLNSGIIFSTSSYSDAYAGGICARSATITISNCSNSGTISSISSSRDAYAGGICGILSGIVINCYNVGNITAQGTNGEVYGIGGESAKNCYNAGTLTGTIKIGCATNSTNCYYLDTCGATIGGTSKTETEMKDPSLPLLLNADSVVFRMDITPNINQGYPIFGKGIYVQTGDADNIQGTSATLHGNYYAESVTAVGFEYKLANETIFTKVYTNIGIPVTYQLTGLADSTFYDYCLFIEKDSTIYRGAIKQFTTIPCNLSVTISGTTTICQGETTTLTASGANSHLWSDNSTQATFTTSTAGTYTVTGTDANGCTATDTAIVVVNPTYNTPISQSICQGESYNFHGQILTTSGVYTHTLTSAQGCDSIITLTLIVNSLPTVTISGTTTICQGETTTLTANGGNSYVWSNNSTQATFTTLTAGTYTVTGTDGNGCSSTASANVVVNPTYNTPISQSICQGESYNFHGQILTTSGVYTHTLTSAQGCDSIITLTLTVNSLPTVTISGTTTICQGETTTLTANGANSYVWSNNSINATLTIADAGTYTVTGTNVQGCSATATTYVTVNSLPIVTINGNTEICQGESTTLTANGGTTYQWNNGTTGATNHINTFGLYTVTVTNAEGCRNTATTAIIVNSLPVIHINGNTEICQGESTTLTANGAASYLWNNGVNNSSITTSNAGTYMVIGTDANGCSSTESITVTMNYPVFEESPATACDSYTWNGTTYTTSGDYTWTGQTINGCDSVVTLHLTINHSATNAVTATACDSYTWNDTTYTTSGDYTWTGQTSNGCDSVVTLHLTINNSVTEEITEIIEGSYEWNGIIYTETGDYTWVGQTAAGCDSTVILHLTITTDITQYAQAANIEVWPNPAQTVCNISCSIAQAELRLYDAIGRCVSRAKAESEITPIDVTSFAPGIYILHVVSDGKTIATKKVVVRR